MTNIRVVQHGSLWVAHVPTSYGHMELLCGEGGTPDERILALVERFLDSAIDHIAAVRRNVFAIPILWRPIRFAVNNEGRLGLQFRHRITGRQEGMSFADDHSSFKTTLDVTPSDGKMNQQR